MTIEIVNNPNKEDSPESLAAIDLKEMLLESMPTDVAGKLYIATNLTLCGQEVRDIDIAIWGNLSNYTLKNYYTNAPQYAKKDLVVKNFFMVLEVKELSIDSLSFEHTHIWGDYPDRRKDITEQSEKQRYSMKRYLNSFCGLDVFVTNVIWLSSVNREELKDLAYGIPVGALPGSFNFRDIIDIAILQGQKPWYDKDSNCYIFTIGEAANNFSSIKQKLFYERRVSSKLTRRKLELLTQKNAETIVDNKVIGNDLSTLYGKAGTGKTFILLQAAYQLASKDRSTSCVLLTYNLALVSDIRRLVHYLFLENIEEDKILITTLHKFFIRMMDVYEIPTQSICGNAFDGEYKKKLIELHDYVDAMDDNDAKELKNSLGCDYVLVDEAQDWDPLERNILVKVYGAERLIVADGGQQFIRSNKHLDWGGKEIKLDVGRRQKSSLVKFVNLVAKEMGVTWAQKGDRELTGGKVRILRNYDDIHSQLTAYCKDQQCENYDMLFLVPPQMINHDNSHSYFKELQNWKEKGIIVFDGTDQRKRDEYPTDAEECRLFQYESCRGLEGWVVVCMEFDNLMKWKKEKFDPQKHSEKTIAIESYDEKLKKYLWMWTMLPFTRAIDTLVITLADPNSETGQMLKRVADEIPDIVKWEI